MSVGENLGLVRQRIRAAALAAGRAPESVRLICVSKFQSAQAIREAYAGGQRDFGENYVQELDDKAAALEDLKDLSWHMIGHLQRNKARKVVALARSVHSVDSVELAHELGKRTEQASEARAARLGADQVRLDVLVEVSVAGETQKSGVSEASLGPVLQAVDREPALRLAGLMCVPPYSEKVELSKIHFEALSKLRNAFGGSGRLPELSMGMTQDLEYAVAAGATLVRVGTAVFGARPPRASSS